MIIAASRFRRISFILAALGDAATIFLFSVPAVAAQGRQLRTFTSPRHVVYTGNAVHPYLRVKTSTGRVTDLRKRRSSGTPLPART